MSQQQGDVSQEALDVDYLANLIAPGVVKSAQALNNVVMIFMGWLSTSLEVFLRYEFGERYLSWSKLVLAWLALRLFIFLSVILVSAVDSLSLQMRNFSRDFSAHPLKADTSVIEIFVLLFVLLGVAHRIRIWRRNAEKPPIEWHSYNFGRSWVERLNPLGWIEGREITVPQFASRIVTGTLILPKIGGDWFYFRWFEPIAGFFLAYLIWIFNPVLALWVGFASLAMFFKNQGIFLYHRNRVLDLRDAKIEAEYFNQEASPNTTTGQRFSNESMPSIAQSVANPFAVARSVAGDLKDTVDEILGTTAQRAGMPAQSQSVQAQNFSETLAQTLTPADSAAPVASALEDKADTPE